MAPSGPRRPCPSSSSFIFAGPAPQAEPPSHILCSPGRGVRLQDMGLGQELWLPRAGALHLLVAERPSGHLWLFLLVTVDGGAEAICGCLQLPALPDAGLAFGLLPGQLPHQALGTRGTHQRPPTEMELPRPCLGPSGSELASTVGNKLANALTEFYCLDPTCHFCVGGSNGELVEGKLPH